MIRSILFLSLVVFLGSTEVLLADEPARLELRLAVVAPVTGNFAPYGEEVVRGAGLAISHLPKEDSVIASLIVEDACLPADAIRAAQKLVDIDSIDAVVGSYCVIGMVPMTRVFERNKTIAFHTSAVAEEMLSNNTFIFTTNVTIADEARELARFAFKAYGPKAAVLWLQSQWGANYERYFIKEFEGLGGEIVATVDDQIGNSDFRTSLSVIRSKKPDSLLVVHIGPELGSSLKQARQLGLTMPFLGAHESEEQSVLDLAGEAAEGLTVFSPTLSQSGESVARFRKDFEEKYGASPGVLAANSYDATNIAIDALRSCRGDRVCARDKIYKIKDYPGVSGTFSITSDGGTVKSFSRREVRNGRFVPATVAPVVQR